jgi:Co/Zn/Cd efflux system component
MTLERFQPLCVVVILITLAVRLRAARRRSFEVVTYALLAIAAWLGENTMVEFYAYYKYSEQWALRIHHVPVLVPLIWPLVILSARDVVLGLRAAPSRGTGEAARVAALTGGLVIWDASLVEVIAVRAGFWSWVEPGHLGVPILGVLGWGFFAAGASFSLDVWPPTRGVRSAVLVLVAPLLAHALVLLAWWAIFRWTPRVSLDPLSTLILGGVGVAFAWGLARRQGRIGVEVAAPRIAATLLFLALLGGLTAQAGVGAMAQHWAHTLAIALPYLATTQFRRRPLRA